ncbi:MAG: sensor histidine kinase, partial [Eubacteriales bacterium]|nr:sensor histidine kinase [Eubacteriales bacterium]
MVIAIVALLMLGSLNREYEVTLQNATTASEFNFDFKDSMDLDMYLYVVQSRDMPNLPLEEVYQAQRVLQRLKRTTTQEENCWRIESMLNLSERMESCMIE